jgi:hypothetical protein
MPGVNLNSLPWGDWCSVGPRSGWLSVSVAVPVDPQGVVAAPNNGSGAIREQAEQTQLRGPAIYASLSQQRYAFRSIDQSINQQPGGVVTSVSSAGSLYSGLAESMWGSTRERGAVRTNLEHVTAQAIIHTTVAKAIDPIISRRPEPLGPLLAVQEGSDTAPTSRAQPPCWCAAAGPQT